MTYQETMFRIKVCWRERERERERERQRQREREREGEREDWTSLLLYVLKKPFTLKVIILNNETLPPDADIT
jgi:hypothetical protein